MDDSLKKKVDRAVRLLQSIPNDEPIEISYSSGKDSDVILALAKMSGIKYRAIYKNTTIDPPGTIAHAKAMGAEVVHPKQSFFEIVRQNGVPSRWARFCCEKLKEYKICDRAVQGIRRCESRKRAERYKEPEVCRLYPHGEKVRVYLPILEWTDEDVAKFVTGGIQCHPLYYDEQGNFHVERRLGCIGCPLASMKKRREEFKEYPGMLRAYVKNYQIYLDRHKDSKIYRLSGGDAIRSMFLLLFCGSGERYDELVKGDMFPDYTIDPKQYMEDYFKIDLTI